MAQTVAELRACGLNTVLPYANGSSGNAAYPSSLLPADTPPAPDTLGLFSRAAEAHGLETIPVVCVLVSGHKKPTGILQSHPDWALRDTEGAPLGWISPAHPEARAWLVALVREIALHAGYSGLLLDYMRFPNQPIQLDPPSQLRFDAEAPPKESPEARATRLHAFKEASLTQLAREISQALRSLRADFQIGLYTWGPHVTASHHVAQPWNTWIREGYIDLLNVSGYCYVENYGERYLDEFQKRLTAAVALARETQKSPRLSFALGVKTSHGEIPRHEEIPRYLDAARAAGIEGVAVFTAASLAKWTQPAAQAGYFAPANTAPPWTLRLRADFGKDLGQDFGSLFEIRDTTGQVLAGAGFMAAYNTYYRADRHTLHAYVRPTQQDHPQITPLPRPSAASQTYPYDHGDQVFAVNRKPDSTPQRWDDTAQAWTPAPHPAAPLLQVGTHVYALAPNSITQGDNIAFQFDPAIGTAGSYYYAAGHLFFHVALANSPDRKTRLYASPWDPTQSDQVSLENPIVLELSAPGEFPYSYGQLHGDVIIGSNNGGVYRFRAGTWHTLRTADPKTSFQLYTMVNYRDRLLMGQYPTGELFELIGDELRLLEGWPPRPPAASPRAREAQTLAIYRGELFVGLWPWGEIWRYNDATWGYVGRLFSQPALLENITAPWENEMDALGEKINNLWGQRVTGFVPLGGDMLVSTSSKNGTPFEERYNFLAPDHRQEYGAVHRLHLPGHRSMPTQWTGEATHFQFEITPKGLKIAQDNRTLGILPIQGNTNWSEATIHIGQGVYGAFNGKLDRLDP